MNTIKITSEEKLRKKLSPQMRKNRDKGIKEKVELFYLALRLGNVREACARRGVSRDFYYRWWKRLVESKFKINSLEDKSSRPHSSPDKIPLEWEVRIRTLRKRIGCGPEMLRYYLLREGKDISESTIGHVLRRRKKRCKKKKLKLKAHRKRYELPVPGQRLQMDIKYSPRLVDGRKTYTYVAIDECTRWRFARTFEVFGGYQTTLFLDELKQKAPFLIQCLQTDNGAEFTNRLQPYEKRARYDEHPMETWCRENNVYHRKIPPGEKELNGKVERSHRIDEEWFYYKGPCKTLEGMNMALGKWIHRYNYERPHGGLKGMTPVEKLIERRMRLPYENLEERFSKAKYNYLKDQQYRDSPSLYLLHLLEKELHCYNGGIRGLDASGRS